MKFEKAGRSRSLRAIELEVEAEGREWMRQRLEEKLQEEAERDGTVSPLSQRKARHRRREAMSLETGVGLVELKVWYGKDPQSGKWGCPIRQRWGLTAHQRMSPALEDKLAFTITATGSYSEAAALAQKWGSLVDDSTLHRLAKKLGQRAEENTQERLASLPKELWPVRKASKLGVLMLDGYLLR